MEVGVVRIDTERMLVQRDRFIPLVAAGVGMGKPDETGKIVRVFRKNGLVFFDEAVIVRELLFRRCLVRRSHGRSHPLPGPVASHAEGEEKEDTRSKGRCLHGRLSVLFMIVL